MKAHKYDANASPGLSLVQDKRRLVIIDDDTSMQSLLSDVFNREGYDVVTFSDATVALSWLAEPKNAADAVVCDLNMPRMNGIDFIELTHNFNPGLPVILITAFGAPVIARTAYDSGAFGYLSKPFQLSELSEFVKRAVERSCA